ncbi:hypothetical protein BGZ83_008096 [Gryganskiella cystojenkinii]|nr:hypothetical protein BGZ83_008096 [Gryganskiella cystojenkinii]
MLKVQQQTNSDVLDRSPGGLKGGLSSSIVASAENTTSIEDFHPLAGGLTTNRAVHTRTAPAKVRASAKQSQGPKGSLSGIDDKDHHTEPINSRQDEIVTKGSRIHTSESSQDSHHQDRRSIERNPDGGGDPLATLAPESAVKKDLVHSTVNGSNNPRSLSSLSTFSPSSGLRSDRVTETPSAADQPTSQQLLSTNGPLSPSSPLKSRPRTLSAPTRNQVDHGHATDSDLDARPFTMQASVVVATTEGSVRKNILDPLLSSQSTTSEREKVHAPISRRRLSSAGHHQLSSSITAQHPALEHLSDMGPLELEREIDSGVHWDHDPVSTAKRSSSASASVPSSSRNSGTSASIPEEPAEHGQAVHHTHSSSTLVSNSSSVSSQSGAGTLSGPGRRLRGDRDGPSWDGDHPLLLDFTMEPELLEEEEAAATDGLPKTGNSSSALRDRTMSSLRHKGHSMSVDTAHESSKHTTATGVSFQVSESPSSSLSRRRRNVSRTQEDLDDHKDLGHSRTMTTTESVGKRVIIHQVALTDTLAGIALYYGIQVPILKKSNKLWTNDSIHTRKYLYIPFEDCSVTRQEGVLVDESSHSVLLPQRRQTSQSRTGPFAGGQASSFTPSRMSTYDPTLSSNNSLPSSHGGRHLSGYRPGMDPSSFSSETPEISAVAAGMLPIPVTLSSSTSIPVSFSTISPRLGTWTDSKTVAAPPMPSSPTITTFLRKSDYNNHSSVTPLSPARVATTTTARDGHTVSESLPDTVIVAPSMTHEALAARFKEMDIVSAEQLRKSQQAREQELRTNPIHHRHRTSDLRQYAHLQQQLPTRSIDEGSISSSSASSRTSVETSGIRELIVKSGQQGSRGGSAFGHAVDSGINPGSAIQQRVEELEEDELHQDDDQTSKSSDGTTPFVTFGHHQHIYQSYYPGSASGSSHHGLEDSTSSSSSREAVAEQPRRQELITVPEGMLSFFPSPEHSKRLETPQSISKLQYRDGPYQTSPASTISSTTSSTTGNRRDGSSRTGANGVKTKSRTSLGEQTFEAPNSSGTSSQSAPRPTTTIRRTDSSGTSASLEPQTLPSSSTSSTKNPYSKTVRANNASSSAYSPHNWSLMGESLVDDLLGAVRGPLQIARRMYNLSSFGFGGATSTTGSGKEGYQDSPSLSRRVSSGGGSRRSRNGRGNHRNSIGYAIELDQAKTPRVPALEIVTPAVVGGGIVKRMPTNESIESGGSRPSGRGSMRRKSSSGSSGGHGHGPRQGSTSSTSNDGSNTVRKRSLRSSNPVNHGALMALVNELDKDKKEKEKRGQSFTSGKGNAAAVERS